MLAKPPDVAGSATSAVPVNLTLKRLQTLLSDRFTLSLKREPRTVAGYVLSVAKSGNKMTSAEDPGDPLIRQTGRWGIKAERVPMPLFTRFLSARLHTSVIDQTELKDRFNFELKWAPEPHASV